MHLPEVASGKVASGTAQRSIDPLRYGLVALLLAVQLLAALILISRVAAGALDPSGRYGLLLWALLAALLAGGVRLAWHTGAATRTPAANCIVAFAPLAAVLLTAFATLLAGSSPGIAALACGLLVGEELLTHAMLGTLPALKRVRNALGGGWFGFRSTPTRHPPANGQPADSDAGTGDCGPAIDGLPPGAALADLEDQRLVRSSDLAGGDVLAGLMAARFAEGQSTVSLHVAFCPPFACVPQFEFRQLGGPAARLKVGQLLAHGARLEVKLLRAAEAPSKVVLQIRARHPAVIANVAVAQNAVHS